MSKVLFVLTAAGAGGTATSMLNLLELLKQKGVPCDLFILEHNGCFLERARSTAHLLPEERLISSVLCDKTELPQRGFLSFCIRACFTILNHIIGGEKARAFFFQLSARKLSGKYDTVVAYQEDTSSSYTQYIQAKRKISWFHTDFDTYLTLRDHAWIQSIYDRFDEIVCVTNQSRDSMIKHLELEPEHVHVIYNTIPVESIRAKAVEQVENIRKAQFTFVSMGRVCATKGFDRACRVAAQLRDKKISFTWYILGDGEDYNKILSQIKNLRLQQYVVMLGLKPNPFPYIKQADCFILTSRYEAQPMAANEALTLGVPVITTRFASAKEVIRDCENGLVVDNSEQGILEGVCRFTSDEMMRIKIKDGARNFQYDNLKIIGQVRTLIQL